MRAWRPEIRRSAGLLLLALVMRAQGGETAWWVWHRAAPLREPEASALGEGMLFWHVGVLENRDGTWRWKGSPIGLPARAGAAEVIPVLRLESSVRDPFADRAQLLREMARLGESKLQIDYDCPDRLLGEYAAVLREIRGGVKWLSATALAGWSRNPAWEQLQGAVDELAPMFYDLRADPPAVGTEALPLPLIEPAEVARDIEGWKQCRIPWRAGLPNFARLTLYDAGGKLRGHLRDWEWEEVCFNRALETLLPTLLGVTLMRASEAGRIGETPFAKGDLLTARWPDRVALRSAIETAEEAGARGVIWFRLPDRGDGSGWSVAQIAQLDQAEPAFSLRVDGSGRLVLRNDSNADAPPRIAGDGPQDRGYALEIDAADASIWREALPGEFWRVGAHVNPEARPSPVAVPLAKRLTFWLSHLRAGDSLTTGLLQLAPGARMEEARWRIVPGDGEWKKIEP